MSSKLKGEGNEMGNLDVLTPNEAADFLGITPELLFAYARYPAKRNLGHERTLEYVSEVRSPGFRREALEDFDKYLREPWSDTGDTRPTVPSYIQDYLKVESGGRCARCGKGYRLVNAHITPYSETRSHHHHNLIRLCSECHDYYDAGGLLLQPEIDAIKTKLVAATRARLRRENGDRYPATGRAPNPADQFVGRDDEIATLVHLLNTERAVRIEGPGGIGKTQLLLQALRRMEDDYQPFWVDASAYTSVTDVQMGLSMALSAAGDTVRVDAIERALDEKEIRIVFDGIESVAIAEMDGLEDLFRRLLSMTNKPRFVFTSQVELNGLGVTARLCISTLARGDGVSILASALEEDESNVLSMHGKEIAWIADLCEGHPLSLQICAGLIRHFKSPAVVVNQIRLQGGQGLKSAARTCQTKSTSLDMCLRTSYQALSMDQRRLLWVISHCPAGCLQLSVDEETFGIPTVEVQVAALQRWHLASVQTDPLGFARIHVLSPIRTFAVSAFPEDDPAEADRLLFSLVLCHTFQAMILDDNNMQHGDVLWGSLRFEQELPNFLWALHMAADRSKEEKYAELVVAMANSLMVYCFVSGLLDCGVSVMQLGVDAALALDRQLAASNLLLKLLTFAGRLCDSDIVRYAVTSILKLAEGSDDPRLLGDKETARAVLAMRERRYDAAAEFAGAAARYYEKGYRDCKANDSNGSASDPVGQDDSAQHMVTLAYMSQGDAFLKAKNPRAASLSYEKALKLVRKAGDLINLGSILNQIGNCQADLGEYEESLRSYFDAAKQFWSIGSAEYLSNSLSNAAYVLFEWDPPTSVDSYIDEEVLRDGLWDIAEETKGVFLPSQPELPADRCSTAVLKVFGMMALASFSSHNLLLRAWAESLREEVVRPFAEDDLNRNPLEIMLLAHLDYTLALAGAVSCIAQPDGIGPEAKLAELEHYAWLCFEFHEPGWRAFRPFKWLSTYLRRHRGVPFNVSAEALLKAAEKAANGNPFTIKGLN